MTSADQMSSLKPPVGQSTFGFPDDPPLSVDFSPPRTSSAHRLSVGMLTPPAHLPSSPSRPWRPARLSALQKMREAPFLNRPPSPPAPGSTPDPHQTPVCAHLCGYVRLIPKNFLRPNVDSRPPLANPRSKIPKTSSVCSVSSAPAVSSLSNFQNVEKLSFQARLNCLYRQSENFLITPKVNIFPNCGTPIRWFALSLFRLPPSWCLRALGGRPDFCRKTFISAPTTFREANVSSGQLDGGALPRSGSTRLLFRLWEANSRIFSRVGNFLSAPASQLLSNFLPAPCAPILLPCSILCPLRARSVALFLMPSVSFHARPASRPSRRPCRALLGSLPGLSYAPH